MPIIRPLISIVTPSLNCADYIRQCISSICDQNYAQWEHIVVDGASTDGTVAILEEYPHLTWISERDSGEANALNKGLRIARGEIVAWLNADDYYLPGTLSAVAQAMAPLGNRHVIYGKTRIVDSGDQLVGLRKPVVPASLPTLLRWFNNLDLFQPSIFYSRELVEEVGPFREDLWFSIDYEYWLRIVSKGYEFHFVDQVFSSSRLVRPDAKSGAPRGQQEKSWSDISGTYAKHLDTRERMLLHRDYLARFVIPRIVDVTRGRARLRTRMARVIQNVRDFRVQIVGGEFHR